MILKYYKYVSAKISNHTESIKGIEENIKLIKECLENYYNSRLAEAYDNIKRMLIKYADGDRLTPFVVAAINENYAFRGCAPEKIRPVIYTGKKFEKEYEKMINHSLTFFRARIADETIQAKDMLHIPFNKRNIVGSQRFSIPGIPCIYLSTSSYGAWIELERPESNQFQVSSVQIPTDIRILNLCIQQYLIDGKTSLIGNAEEEKQARACLEIFPLVIATSYQVEEKERKFKSEYIISQIVMQVCSEIGIGGVAYLSKRTKDLYAYPYAVNLAIAIPNNKGSLYWERAGEVKITEPVRFTNFLSKGVQNENNNQHFLSYVNEIFKDNYSKNIIIDGMEIEYIKTNFSAFDEYILKQNYMGFTELL